MFMYTFVAFSHVQRYHVLMIIPEEDLCAGVVLTAVSRPFDVHLTSTAMKLIYSNTFDKHKRSMYAIFLQCTLCVKKTLTVSCTLLCESGDRVMVDQSSFSAD